MGLNLGSEEFWELRPDNFIRMSRAYDERQDIEWLRLRKLCYYTLLSSPNLTEDIKERDIFKIPRFDKPVKVEPIILSEEIKEKVLKIAQSGSTVTIHD